MYLAAMSTTPLVMPTNSSNSRQQFIAKVLRPEDAVPSVDGQPLQSTLYRHDTLMVFSRDWSGDFDTFVEITLKEIGLDVRVESPQDIPPTEQRPKELRLSLQASEGLGVPLVLRLLPSTDVPLVGPVDAWRALQYVRFKAVHSRPEFQKPAERMSLEHILRAATAPVQYWGLPGWEGHGDDGEDGPGRIPVKVVATSPPHRTLNANFTGVRPVVAIFDTPVANHDWLPTSADTPEWVVQQLPPQPLPEFDLLNPLVGRVDSHFGHGTFIAGIIHQIAPEAQVLSLPVMHSDGCVLEADLVSALSKLLDAVTNGFQVDVILLALGYYPETPGQPVNSPLLPVLQDLAAQNVKIVAAVGNDATTRECYPAAYSKALPNIVHAVGAENPNESKAIFSNDNPSTGQQWVTEWKPGVAIVSTYPAQVDGSRSAALSKESLERESFDADAFDSGFALWQGTSFAAAVYAAELAAQATPPQP